MSDSEIIFGHVIRLMKPELFLENGRKALCMYTQRLTCLFSIQNNLLRLYLIVPC